jgi:chromosomal replication initiation ATPase DnaA
VSGSVQQLPLTLPHRPQMTSEDFLVGSANAEAFALIDAWPAWPASPVVLSGPAGAGKTHLVEIWRSRNDAAVVAATELEDDRVDELVERGAVAVEDLHAAPLREAALFHLLNLAAERKAALLLTSRVAAPSLPIALPDLASRLRAARAVELGAPDDALLDAVLVKLFSDRQLTVEPAVLEYILRRMERSLEAANILVEYLDREALAGGGPVTRRLVSRALAGLFPGTQDPADEAENPRG